MKSPVSTISRRGIMKNECTESVSDVVEWRRVSRIRRKRGWSCNHQRLHQNRSWKESQYRWKMGVCSNPEGSWSGSPMVRKMGSNVW